MGQKISISGVKARAFQIPTDYPESDGTLEWDHTEMVLVEASAGGKKGIGYSYTSAAAVSVIERVLAPAVTGKDALDVQAAWNEMVHRIRNLGRGSLVSMAIAAVDTALWDLKARLLEKSLASLWGMARDRAPVYGSGGFTSYPEKRLADQLGGWVKDGITRVKMKIGREPEKDPARVAAARRAIGDAAELFVDANGAYQRKQAIELSRAFADLGVTWYEEPVGSDDLEGLRFIRERVPPAIEVTAGEYGFTEKYFRRMLESGAVDVMQADVTRCEGFSNIFRIAALCDAFQTPLSTHTAPSLHLPFACAVPSFRHMEYFHDHARIESLFFDGFMKPMDGCLSPDLSRPGLGLEVKWKDIEKFKV